MTKRKQKITPSTPHYRKKNLFRAKTFFTKAHCQNPQEQPLVVTDQNPQVQPRALTVEVPPVETDVTTLDEDKKRGSGTG